MLSLFLTDSISLVPGIMLLQVFVNFIMDIRNRLKMMDYKNTQTSFFKDLKMRISRISPNWKMYLLR